MVAGESQHSTVEDVFNLNPALCSTLGLPTYVNALSTSHEEFLASQTLKLEARAYSGCRCRLQLQAVVTGTTRHRDRGSPAPIGELPD